MKDINKKKNITLEDIKRKLKDINKEIIDRTSLFQESLRDISFWKKNPILLLLVSSILILLSSIISFLLGRKSKSDLN